MSPLFIPVPLFRRHVAPAMLGCVLLGGLVGKAHETAPPPPTDAELALVEPPLAGSDAFAAEALLHLRSQLDEAGLLVLDRLEAAVRQRDQSRWSQTSGVNSEAGEYYRWRGEQALLELLEKHLPVLTLDYRPGAKTPNPDDALAINPQDDLLLLKVILADGRPSFRLQDWDLTAEYPHASFNVDVAATGECYLLLSLRNVPESENSSLIGFKPPGSEAPVKMHALKFAPRQWGHLALDIEDETGPTPALLSIASNPGGRLWEPPGAMDFRPLMNDIVQHLGLAGRGYMFYLPGALRGRYWIVADPLEVTLPTGKWDIRVLHGPEYSPIMETVEVRADEWTRRSYELKRWTNMPKAGWYSGDDHVHARLMNSEDAAKLIAYARATDVHVANILEMGDHQRTWYLQRGYGPEFRVHEQGHWLVPGQEDPRSVLGHAIGLNLKEQVRDLDKYLLNDWLAEEIHRQGGLYGHTHVGANACMAHRQMAIFTPLGIVDFNSIMQADLGTELYYNLLNLGFKMTASAGADTPYGGTIGATRVYAYVGESEAFTPDAWFAALGKGHTFVTNGPMLDLRVGDSRPGDEVELTSDQPVRVTLAARGLANHSAPKELTLVKLGEPERTITSEAASQESLELSVDLNPGDGCWIAAHAKGHDGSQAHTTPIYLVRPGHRHWRQDRAEELIDRQLAILDETDQALAESEQMVSTRGNQLDYWNRLNAEQAKEVRVRIANARAAYEHLRQVLQHEQKKSSSARHSGAPNSR
jgi:hypothetical protein